MHKNNMEEGLTHLTEIFRVFFVSDYSHFVRLFLGRATYALIRHSAVSIDMVGKEKTTDKLQAQFHSSLRLLS
jgi:hypothetical protein